MSSSHPANITLYRKRRERAAQAVCRRLMQLEASQWLRRLVRWRLSTARLYLVALVRAAPALLISSGSATQPRVLKEPRALPLRATLRRTSEKVAAVWTRTTMRLTSLCTHQLHEIATLRLILAAGKRQTSR